MERSRAPERALEEAAALLPPGLRGAVLSLPASVRVQAEEIRLRAGRPMTLVTALGERPIPGGGGAVSGEQLETVLEIASRASAHTALSQVKSGFVTVRGGHRVGICGSGVVSGGELCNLRQISSLSIRVARQWPGIAERVLPEITENGLLLSTLILSPPGGGKTTLLREIIRCVSDGEGAAPLRVGLADERGELAAMEGGLPQMDVGLRTDVIDHCPKGPALLMLLRAMNPQALAADEITAAEDAKALEAAAWCGVTLLTTAHGACVSDLRGRPAYRFLLERGLFRRLVRIGMEGGRRVYEVLSLDQLTPGCGEEKDD